MPKLGERKTVTIDLKEVEGGQVTLFTDPTAADVERIAGAQASLESGTVNSVILPLCLLIKEWNLQGEDDKPLPITTENVGRLHFRDMNLIFEHINLGKAPSTEKKS